MDSTTRKRIVKQNETSLGWSDRYREGTAKLSSFEAREYSVLSTAMASPWALGRTNTRRDSGISLVSVVHSYLLLPHVCKHPAKGSEVSGRWRGVAPHILT